MEQPSLEAQVGAALLERNWTICVAESCTGGLLAHRLTNVPGSSAYVTGGVVAYSYEAKQRLLNVSVQTLTRFGAVSEQTAAEMVRGVLNLFSADIAISITGIAGPGGGMPHKPVGLTYIGLAVPALALVRVDRHQFQGDRETIKMLSADEALRKVLAVAREKTELLD